MAENGIALKRQPQSQLHSALERCCRVFSKRRIHLLRIAKIVHLELSIGIDCGEVRGVENVIHFGAKLHLHSLAGQGDPFEQRHIPVVDSRSAKVVLRSKTLGTLRSTVQRAARWRRKHKTIESRGVGKGSGRICHIAGTHDDHSA